MVVLRSHGRNKVPRGSSVTASKLILLTFVGPFLLVVPITISFLSVGPYNLEPSVFNRYHDGFSRYELGTDQDSMIYGGGYGAFVQKTRPIISAIILTYKSHQKFERLLVSTLQQQPRSFDLVIADNGCLPETKEIISRVFGKRENKWLSYKYLELCHNPGYAVGNNEAVKLAGTSSEWVLFLNDDIVMQKNNFIASMLELATSKSDVIGAVGCTLRSIDGKSLQESGSIVWRDASAAGYGRGRRDLDASDLIYPHPVDYVSGACLMVKKNIFASYGGFDHGNFPNYYEDTDLQMHIQHDLKREVWLQPEAVALHDEHGSFGATDAVRKMENASVRFREKWMSVLEEHHLPNPYRLPKQELRNQFLRASDLHARNPANARILYLHLDPSDKHHWGSGFDRVHDNVAMLSELGHRITLVLSDSIPSWQSCHENCREDIRQMGVELVLTSWEEHFQDRIGFYEIVIVSRPSTFHRTYSKLRDFYRKSSFVLLYDCETLWYRHDEGMAQLYQNGDGIEFPSLQQPPDGFDLTSWPLIIKRTKDVEIRLLGMADIIIHSSEDDSKIMSEMIPGAQIHTVGAVAGMKEPHPTKKAYQQRNGILFAADFSGEMYDNGDAIWYFLNTTYPLVIQESTTSIPLTIAGKKIPDFLTQYVKKNGMDQHVQFLESPRNLDSLYESHRIFIAPNLYGSGIKYKLRDALSAGIPCVLSSHVAHEFGSTHPENKVGCIGSTPKAFKQCIISIYGSEQRWDEFQQSGMTFLQTTHDSSEVKQQLANVISMAKNKYKEVKAIEEAEDLDPNSPRYITHNLFSIDLWSPQQPCPEGESMYRRLNPDADAAVKVGEFESAFVHWRNHGRHEGRTYLCMDDGNVPKPSPVKRKQKPPPPTKACPEGEVEYLTRFPDVMQAVQSGRMASAFVHWELYGQADGRPYECRETSADEYP